MPKDRHKGRRMQFYLSDDELGRLDRLVSGCKTDHERFLKLMKMAYGENEQTRTLRNKVKTLESQIEKLINDSKDKDRKIEELQKQPQSKVEYREVIKEVPKIEYRDRIVEKPQYMERIRGRCSYR